MQNLVDVDLVNLIIYYVQIIFILAACLAPLGLQSPCFTPALFICLFFSQKTSLGSSLVHGSGGQWRAVLPNIYSKHVEILDNIFSVRLVNRLQLSQYPPVSLDIFSVGGPVRVPA